jgi:predicted glycosyltransferase
LIETLEKYGKPLVSTERDIDPEFNKYKINVSPEKIHSLLYYASLFIGDSQTMTSEAAILGTPALKCNSFAGKLSVPNELENRYQLCYSFLPEQFETMLEKVKEFLEKLDLKAEWQKRRQKMLSEKIDVTAFLVWFVENWPVSIKIMEKNPEYQERFK